MERHRALRADAPAERRNVVPKEKDECVDGHIESVQMIENVAQRLVHACNQCGERLRRRGFSGIPVMGGKTRVRVERHMNGVVRHVKEEWLARVHGIGNSRFRLNGQRLRQKRVGAVVFFQVRNCAVRSRCSKAVLLRRVIAARRSE